MRNPPTVCVPSRQTLVDFFGKRSPCTVAKAVAVTGYSTADIRRLIATGEMDFSGCRIPWSDVALAFEEAWPADLKESLLCGVDNYPALLRTTPITWRLPRYLLVALELQAVREPTGTAPARRRLSVDDFVREQLHLALDEETISELRMNREFRAAYFFPEEP